MPSHAYGVFTKNLRQVDKLLQAFTDLRPHTRGRKHLDHLTRAAILFLCSSWEVYLEQVSQESCGIIARKLSSPKDLPEKVRKTLSRSIRAAKNELEPVEFAMDWRFYYCVAIQKYVARLNTPKNGQVLEIMEKYLGADVIDVKEKIPQLSKINEIVKIRGEIAHNIFSEDYVKEDMVISQKTTIVQLVKEIELYLYEYLALITDGRKPWQSTY